MARGRRGGGGKNFAVVFETSMDMLHRQQVPPTLLNGMYSFTGNQMSFSAQVESMAAVQEQSMAQDQNAPVQQLSITLIGNKIQASNECCYTATLLSGSFCILPLLLMCCMWWKKIVYPLYELTPAAYQSVIDLIRLFPSATNLTLSVTDNAFGAEKARMLCEALRSSRLTTFSFTNRALACNGAHGEADDFRSNMLPFKSMSLTSSIVWGDMII